jgi:hypothetical protein
MTADDNRSVATMPAIRPRQSPPGPAGPSARKRGRPKGSLGTPSEDLPVVSYFAKTACPTCKGLRRSKYYGRRDLPAAGDVDGRPYRRVVLRRCRCLACGQVRIDRELWD